MREATAYARRIQLLDAPSQTLYFLGLRADGGWSLVIDEDPVYQFNARNELRRAYVAGRKYAAVDGALQLLERDARGGRVKLTQTYDAVAEQRLLERCLELVHQLSLDLKQNRSEIQGCYPADDNSLTGVMLERLTIVSQSLQIAKVANVRG